MTVLHLRTDHVRQRRGRRTLAVIAAGALTFAGLGVGTAPAASAAPQAATAGSLQWGLKGSLLNYHFTLHAGTTQGVTQGDGATASSATRGSGSATYPAFWNFPFVSGSYDPATNAYTAQYGGFVALTESNPAPTMGPGSASPFKYFKIANPKVVIDLASGTKKLILDVQPGADSGPAEPSGPISQDVDFATFPDLSTPATPAGDVVTYPDLAAVLTMDGASSFGGFYPAGTEVDPVSTSLTVAAGGGGGGEDPPGQTPPDGGVDPAAGSPVQDLAVSVVEQPGAFSWEILENNQVSLTEGDTLAGDTFEYTGSLNQVRVTATRLTGSWQISAQVSNFTDGQSNTLEGYRLGWTPQVVEDGANATAGAPVAPGTAAGEGLAVSRDLATGDFQDPDTTGVLDADLRLLVPGSAPAGDYTATLTLTALVI